MKPKESQFPISHVKKLNNLDERNFVHPGDSEGNIKGGRYEVDHNEYNDKFQATAKFEVPGSKTHYNWGSAPTGTYGYSDPKDMQHTFEYPNEARQAAINNASSEHVRRIKSGELAKEPQTIRKGGVVKIDSNPAKGK